jgi:heme-degrading monooxygenase HmoA
MMVQFFNCFEVPGGRDEEFVTLWLEVNAYLKNKPGYVSHQLHRALADARFRFLNHAVWDSAEHWRNAHDEGFRALVSRPQWAPFPSVPALYEVVHEGSAAR